MLVTKILSEQIESCIKQSHMACAKVSRQKKGVGDILEINGGIACFTGHDSFLSQVIGWGFKSLPDNYSDELDQIESFYRQRQHKRSDIELSPFVGCELTELLAQRGYQVAELNQISILPLLEYQRYLMELPKNISIEITDSKDIPEWSKTVASGFGCEEAATEFNYYALGEGIHPFVVRVEGEMAAGGTVAVHGDICDLGVTSTLPNFRGRGLQKLLLQARLLFALERGAKLATVTTEPGSISDLNIQKMGFRPAYTRVKLSKPL